MKRLLALYILISLALANIHAPAATLDITPPTEQADSVGFPAALSEDGESGGNGFLNGVVPLSPQAAALARYAEYPVTRTILGAPDFFPHWEERDDYPLRDFLYIKNAVEDFRHGLGSTDTLTAIADNNPEYDTESDRYTFNACGHTGVFRYSHEDRRFVVLNHDNCRISMLSPEADGGTGFRIEFPDGIACTFAAEERTGSDPDGENLPFVTAWYLTSMETPYGNVEFRYRRGENIAMTREGTVFTAGPGDPRFNGKVSSMMRTMGNDPKTRGYRYSYNQYGWLTLAEYGEREGLDDHRNRYTERFDDFELNGMPCKIQRHGLKADGVYGKVDNLRMTYRGNQLYDVKEDAEPVTTPGSMDFVGPTGRYMQFGYNSSGSLTKDVSRGIEDIEYDNLGNPVSIIFSDGNMTENVYSASGERLWTRHTTGLVSAITPFATSPELDPGLGNMSGTETLEYRGQVIYRNGVAETVLFPGGYITMSGGVTFHYYTRDYLGNNRAVVNGNTGEVEQTIAYYPYGGVIADLGFGHDRQQRKFGGKELTTANRLNEYDFQARQYWPIVPMFTIIDPMCEKYYWLSPYLYCGNDPVNLVDPTGEIPSDYEAALMACYVYKDEDATESDSLINCQN